MKARHVFMSASLAVAAWLALFGDKTSSTDIAEPIARPSAPAAFSAEPVRSSAGQVSQEPHILALWPRDILIGGAQSEKSADGFFGSQSWAPRPPPAPKPLPAPPPSAPPLPFAYLGKKLEDGAWEVYLARADQTFIVNVQAVIEGTYRVESIKPPMMSLTYLPLNQVQALSIGGSD